MKINNKINKRVIAVFFTLNFLLLTTNCFSQGAAINTTGTAADASAILDVSSTSSGMLIPRMTKTQRNAINLPAEGLFIYQTDDTVGFWYRSSGVWKLMGSGAGSSIANGTATGNTLYWDGLQWLESSNIYNAGASVGINTNAPDASALVDMSSTTKGALIPRMTTVERNAIGSPAEGLQIYNITTKCLEIYTINSWEQIYCAFVCGNALIDNRDANSYQTVQIGTQCWMKANLKYLPIVHSNTQFATQATNSQPGYGVWGYDGSDVATAKSQANYTTYGVLYNWHAASGGTTSSANPSGVQGVCPSGWHLPSDAEWKQLEMSLGMSQAQADIIGWRGTDEGNKLREAGTSHWTSPNTGATNSSGFTALPGGVRGTSGSFSNIGGYGSWWSATEDGSDAWRRGLYYNVATVDRNTYDKGYGYAVRCLRD